MAARPNGNRDHDIAIYVAHYTTLSSEDLRAILASRRPSPWERLAIRRVLKARGESV